MENLSDDMESIFKSALPFIRQTPNNIRLLRETCQSIVFDNPELSFDEQKTLLFNFLKKGLFDGLQ